MNETLQIPLSFQPRRNDSFDDFVPGQNQVAVAAVQSFIEPALADSIAAIYLKGDSGSGKTLLLNAVSNKARELGQVAMYLPLNHLLAKSTSPPQDLAGVDILCVDNLESIAGNNTWEVALFHLLNQMHSGNGKVIIAGRQGPEHSGIVLPDLQSRLAWGEVHGLKVLRDIDKQAVLKSRSLSHGLELGDDVIHYLLRYGRRDMKYLLLTIDAFRQAAFASKRAPTVPLLRTVMAQQDHNNKEQENA